MPDVSEREAIDLARRRLALGPETRARAFRVRRLEPPGGSYYLVVFGEPAAALGVAAVEVATGEVTNWAALPGTGPHALVDAETAIRQAGSPAGSRAALVWRSSPGSRSPLYPLWEVSTDEQTVYVDQQGTIWPSLESPARGG
jgi:hypothetical protein